MTWRTSQGERILAGAEATLFRTAVLSLASITDNDVRSGDEPWDFGVPVFDRLTPEPRLAMLATVGFALLRETPECPPLTAVNEATIATIFRHIEESIHEEVDSGEDTEDPFYWRRLVRLAGAETVADLELLAESSSELDEWTFVVETLSDYILWDNDFNSEGVFADAEPEYAQANYEGMGIDEDYFLAVPPDPRASNLDQIRKVLRELERG